MRHLLPLLFLGCAILNGANRLAAAESFAFSSATYSGAEGTAVVITVSRSGNVSSPANVSFATSNGTATSGGLLPGPIGGGSDYSATNGTLHFLADDMSKTFSVSLQSDGSDENDETINLTLSAPSLGYTVGSPAVLTITDVPQINWAAASATNTSPIALTLTFSEAVTGLTAGDFSVTNGVISVLTADSSTSYNIQIQPTAQGQVTVALPMNAVQDADGHGNAPGSSSFVYDSVGPTCVLSAFAPTTTNHLITFTAAFSENVSGVIDTGQLSVTNGYVYQTSGGLGNPGPPTVWTIVVRATATGPVTLTVGAGTVTDINQNPNVESPSATLTVDYTDITSPTVTMLSSNTPNGTYGWGSQIHLRFQFSEPVTLVGGNLTVALNSGESISVPPFTALTTVEAVYTVTSAATAVADLNNFGGLVLALGATLVDLSGNSIVPTISGVADLGTTSDIVLVELNAPSVTHISSTTASGTYGAGSAINITVAFSEPIRFTNGSPIPGLPVHGNFSLSLNSSSAVTYSYSGLTESAPMSTLVMTYTVQPGQGASPLSATAVNLHGSDILVNNAGIRLTTTMPSNNITPDKNIIIDAVRSQVVVTSSVSNPTTASNILVTVTFSEPVTGFVDGDIITNGTVSNLAGSDEVYTFTLGLVPDATTTVDIADEAASDALGNLSLSSGPVEAFSRTHQTAASGSSSSSSSSSCGVGSGLASLALGLLTLGLALFLRHASRG